jgi:hypothetical protein
VAVDLSVAVRVKVGPVVAVMIPGGVNSEIAEAVGVASGVAGIEVVSVMRNEASVGRGGLLLTTR